MNTGKKTFHFDELALHWDDQPFTVERAEKVFAWLREHVVLEETMQCLELGSATGRTGFLLEPLVGRIHLADASPAMVRQAQERIDRSGLGTLSSAVLDLDTQELPSGPWDLVYSSMTLHHVADVPGLLGKIAAVQEEGAWISLVDLYPEDGSFHRLSPDQPVHHGLDPAWLQDLLEARGYGEFKTDTIHRMKKPGADGTVQTYSLFMLSGKKLTA